MPEQNQQHIDTNIQVPQGAPIAAASTPTVAPIPQNKTPGGKKILKIAGWIILGIIVCFALLAWWGYNLEKKDITINCSSSMETNQQLGLVKAYECFYNSVLNGDYNAYIALMDPHTPGSNKGMSPDEWSQAAGLLKSSMPDPKTTTFVDIKQVGDYSLYFISNEVGKVNKGEAVYFIPFRKVDGEWKIYGGVNYMSMFDLNGLNQEGIKEKINQQVEQGTKSFQDGINASK